jgi:mono/diheme cytochrome c family protein
MKRILRIFGILAVVGVVGIAAYLGYFFARYPDAGPVPQITIERTPERIARGKYLAHHVTVCIDCHSTRDWTKFSGPPVSGTEGKGGFRFGEEEGLPGDLYAKNITPAGLSSFNDGELVRSIAGGVTKDGTALFPLMPYPNYRELSREDLYSIISYIRSLAPIENQVPPRHLNFPVSLIVRSIPSPFTLSDAPDTGTAIKRGKYLATAASCRECHSLQVKGDLVAGMEFAGGREFPFPDGTVRSANITPDEESGIGSWTKELFVAKFKAYEHPDSALMDPKAVGYNSVMPWTMFAGMADRDLEAIYAYLSTVTPVKHPVERFTALNQAPHR